MLDNYNFKKKNTWLVTGGAGFIGSNLTEYLLKKKQKVIVIDDLSNGKIENINLIKKKFKKTDLIFIQSDLLGINFNRKIFRKIKYIVHLAALGSVPRSYDDLNHSVKNNVNITLKILESFMYDRRFRVKKNKQIIFPDIYKYLIPGPGYGGSCFPKDTKSFSKFSLSKGLDQKILNAIIFQNTNRLKNKIKFLNNKLKKICIIGVGFKEGTSDLRESKSLELMKILKSKNKSVYYIDQNVNLKNKNYIKINFQDLFKTKIDAVIIMNHSKYTIKFNWKKFTENKKVTVFDFRAKLQPTKRIKVIGSNF